MKRFALILLTVAVALAAELTGKWAGTLEPLGPDGSPQGSTGAYMDLKLSGQIVSGTAGQDEAHQNEISNGKLDGKKLTFEVVRAQGTLKFDLTFDGESIKGMATVERDGERSSAKIDLKRK